MAKKENVSLAIAGASGRMGQALIRAIAARRDLSLTGAWERKGHPRRGEDAGEVAGAGPLGVLLVEDAAGAMEGAQVAIDFTTPASTLANLAAAKKTRTAMVIGTTGMNKGELAKVAAFAKARPVVMASNFSIGVNVMLKAAAAIAKATGDDYDMEIIDVHHNQKKDSPSGTAVSLLESIAKGRGKDPNKIAVFGRHTRAGKRPRGEVGVHALRAGDVVGDHTVLFAGPWERLELSHRSHARENFANGALVAAQWLVAKRKKNGLYSMAEVLGL